VPVGALAERVPRHASEEVPGVASGPQDPFEPPLRVPACSETRTYGGLVTTASTEEGQRRLPIVEASAQRTWKDLPDSSWTLLGASRPQTRYSCSISTPTASRPIRTETTHVEKVPAKGSRIRSPGELTSYISLSIRCRSAFAGCLTASLGKNLR
jgi:hypothetical protein